MKCLLFLFYFLIIFQNNSHAYEVDNFTNRYSKIPEATEQLDIKVNQLMKSATNEMNLYKKEKKLLDSKTCFEKSILHNYIKDALDNKYIIGTIEEYADTSAKIPKQLVTNDQSVYSGVNTKGVVLAFAGTASSVNINGSIIGVDKFGHFFDQGNQYFELELDSKSPREILEYGIEQENGSYGLSTTGVKSFADLNANYKGWLFWRSLTDGQNPYFQCQSGNWVQVRQFTWKDYVDESWDEGINCSEFKTAEMSQQVLEQQIKLESKGKSRNEKYQCPVSDSACSKLMKQNSVNFKYLISPKCQVAAKKFNLSKTTTTHQNQTTKKNIPTIQGK